MLSKEEIEIAKERCYSIADFCKTNKECQENKICFDCYIEIEDISAIRTLLQYIEQQEQEKQKLIETLEKANKEDTESVKRYEKMRRNATSEFYKKSYQTSIHKLNAKREVRRNILKNIGREVK